MKSSVAVEALTMPKNGAKLGARLSIWPDMVWVYLSYGVM